MKKTILLIHGLRGDHHGLADIAARLEKLGYNVLNPDLPGSGNRAELSDKSLEGYSEWLHEYVKEQGVKPYILAHSMGSIIASYYVEKYPSDTQDKIVLLSPIFRTARGQRSSNALYMLTSGSLHLLPKQSRYKFLRSRLVSFCISHYLTADKTQQKHNDELHYQYSGRFASADSLLADIKISMESQTKVLSKKTVLYAIGDKDRLTRSKRVKEIAAKAGSDYVEFNGTGHLINYERPDAVTRVVDEFISFR